MSAKPSAKPALLIVDDDVELSTLVGTYLTENGFEAHFHRTGAGVPALLEAKKPSLLILDVMLPEKNGFDVCKDVRAVSTVPILMLTAQGKVTDRVVGLELGADDYLPKPFEPRELLARVRALLRRRAPADDSLLEFDDLLIDTRARTVSLVGKTLELTSTEFEILLLFATNPGLVLNRDYLITQLRGGRSENLDRSIDIQVSRLRSKLGEGAKTARFIKTVWGTGYVFVGRKKKAA